MSTPDEPTSASANPSTYPGAAARDAGDGLLGRVELVESQPLADRAAGFEQLHDELLAELQRGDHGDV